MRERTPWVHVESAGTHSIPGLPMSVRTRRALEGLGLADPDHRSKQVDQAMIDRASLIAIFEPMHLTYLRRNHPECLARTASLPRFARDLGSGSASTVATRVADLGLVGEPFEAWEEVVDPAGGEVDVFVDSARQIQALVSKIEPAFGVES